MEIKDLSIGTRLGAGFAIALLLATISFAVGLRSVVAMDTVTQQNAALADEDAAVAQRMQEQADNLFQAISVFKLTNGVAVARQLTGLGASRPARQAGKLRHDPVATVGRAVPATVVHEEWEAFR